MSQKISSVMVATRKIVNEETGIDLYIYDERRNIVSTRTIRATYYSLIVVSNLSEFQAMTGQTVQYTLDKSHEEFEKLHASLSKRFSGTLFPEMPKKPIAIMDTVDKARERKIKLDYFVKFCAQTPKVARSEILRKFLGADVLEVDDGDEKQGLENEENLPTKRKAVKTELFTNSIDTKDDELFAEHGEEEEASLRVDFDEDKSPTAATSAKLSAAKLYEDNLKESDAVPTVVTLENDTEKPEQTPEDQEEELHFSEDDSDDDFEELMNRLESAKKTRAEREKSLAKKSQTVRDNQEKTEQDANLDDLSADDVARYISENSSKMDDLDLGL